MMNVQDRREEAPAPSESPRTSEVSASSIAVSSAETSTILTSAPSALPPNSSGTMSVRATGIRGDPLIFFGPPTLKKFFADSFMQLRTRPHTVQLAGNLEDFQCFSKLPPELRIQIWNYALPGYRVIDASGFMSAPVDRTLKAGSIFQVNKESREVALKRFQLVTIPSKPLNASIYLDWTRDTFIFPSIYFMLRNVDKEYVGMYYGFKFEDLMKIRHFAFRIDLDRLTWDQTAALIPRFLAGKVETITFLRGTSMYRALSGMDISEHYCWFLSMPIDLIKKWKQLFDEECARMGNTRKEVEFRWLIREDRFDRKPYLSPAIGHSEELLEQWESAPFPPYA